MRELILFFFVLAFVFGALHQTNGNGHKIDCSYLSMGNHSTASDSEELARCRASVDSIRYEIKMLQELEDSLRTMQYNQKLSEESR